ncbi:MAG: hypothetical protein QXT71_05355, partial [Thermoplasmata archaeon]
HDEAMKAISDGITLKQIFSMSVRDDITRMKEIKESELEKMNTIVESIKKEFQSLRGVKQYA